MSSGVCGRSLYPRHVERPPTAHARTRVPKLNSHGIPYIALPHMSPSLRVLTFNIWGLPDIIISTIYRHASPKPPSKSTRVASIVNALLSVTDTEQYDVICLQEVWCECDAVYLTRELAHVYPHSHYFYAGFTGSGLLLLSRHPFACAPLFHRFTINGRPGRVLDGDWYFAKGIGLCRIRVVMITNTQLQHEECIVNVYLTHTVAQYQEPPNGLSHLSSLSLSPPVSTSFSVVLSLSQVSHVSHLPPLNFFL